MGNRELPGFTGEFIEAGLKLSERDLGRGRFILASADPSWEGPRLAAGENFLAEILADPHLADSCRPFFPAILGLPDESSGLAIPGPIMPWGWRPPAGDDEMTDPLAGAGLDGLDLVRDFRGRVAALMAGAAVSGAAALEERLVYTHSLDGRPILFTSEARFQIDEEAIRLPRRADRILILGFVRGPEIMGMNPGLSRLRPPDGWRDWPGQVAAALKVADWLHSLGFLALPSAGGLVMADHLGAMAGLGELGRQGLLITPEYGPNLRLLTIITDYPFTIGRPVSFGVADYCETCQRCINECPAKALSEGHRRPGLYQWPVNRRACFDHWLEKRDPGRKCIEICPYTREPLVGSPGGSHRPPPA
jgi:hypothetical protein